MTTEEMRELDAFIAEHVMGWKKFKYALGDGEIGFYQYKLTGDVEVRTAERLFSFHPTTDPAASDALDDAILAKLPSGYCIAFTGTVFVIESGGKSVGHPDKKICRALFAKQLFAK